MASSGAVLHELHIDSHIRGYHAYKDVWMPVLNEELVLKREPANIVDINAVAVKKEDDIVGHVPFNLAPFVSAFLWHGTNSGFAKVTGDKVNRGAGYGLEIPCVYSLYGPKPYIDKLKTLVASLELKGLVSASNSKSIST